LGGLNVSVEQYFRSLTTNKQILEEILICLLWGIGLKNFDSSNEITFSFIPWIFSNYAAMFFKSHHVEI
jgi:hypothetical protein